MRYKVEPVSGPDEQEVLDSAHFVAIAQCPNCGARWKSTEALRPDDLHGPEKQGARRVEMVAQMHNGCRNCANAAVGARDRQRGRLRGAWPGSRR